MKDTLYSQMEKEMGLDVFSKPITMDEIETIVTDYYRNHVTNEPKRKNSLSLEARHIAMYFSKKCTKADLTTIGCFYAKKEKPYHHTTVLNAVRSVESKYDSDLLYKNRIQTLACIITDIRPGLVQQTYINQLVNLTSKKEEILNRMTLTFIDETKNISELENYLQKNGLSIGATRLYNSSINIITFIDGIEREMQRAKFTIYLLQELFEIGKAPFVKRKDLEKNYLTGNELMALYRGFLATETVRF